MEPLDAIPAPSLKAVFVCLALLWLFHRAWKVMVIREDDLIRLLGLDVPAAPSASLAGVKADGAVLHWEPFDFKAGVVGYQIKVNGVLVEEVAPKDTSVSITHLKPATSFTVRVIAVNHHNFHTPSDPIRFRTKPPNSGEFFDFPAYQRALELANDTDHEQDEGWWVEAKVQPCKIFPEATIPLPTPPDMVRQHSNSQSHPRRILSGRRNSPANSHQQFDHGEQYRTGETERDLQAEGDRLRSEICATKRTIDDEEKAFLEQKEVFSQRNNELKDELARKTAASTELRKEVVNLEKENQRAQAKKSAEEKTLQQRSSERKRMKEDVERFRAEVKEMDAEVERIAEQKLDYRKATDGKIQEIREKYAEEQQAIKALEESVRDTGIQNRLIEEERKKVDNNDHQVDNQPHRDYAEEDRQWTEKFRVLQQRYQAAHFAMNTAQEVLNNAQNQLQSLTVAKTSQNQFLRQTPLVENVPSRQASQRRRHEGSFGTEAAPPVTTYPTASGPFTSSISSISPNFTSTAPFFDFGGGNGTGHSESVFLLPNRPNNLTPAEVEIISGAGPMSPNAGDLLPSGLFADETDRSGDEFDDGADAISAGSFGDLEPLAGLGAPEAQDPTNRSPSSPVSVQSRSPSLFASPRASSGQLITQDGVESDGRSVKSLATSMRGASGSTSSTLQSRFGQLFNRQRGKTLSDEGPALGSLKPVQSHSMPRSDLAEQDPIGTRRRRGSHSGSSWNLKTSMSRFQRSSTADAIDQDDTIGSPSHVAPRKRGFKMFGGAAQTGWPPAVGAERPSSPRPGSTRSIETSQLPWPSTESSQRFGWNPNPLNPLNSEERRSPFNQSELGMNVMTSFSRHPSRRPSIQRGQSSGFSFEDALAEQDLPSTTRSPPQAPIGTRPLSSQSQMPLPATPPSGKLNPAAPNFILPSWDRSADKEMTEPERTKRAETDVQHGDNEEEADTATPIGEFPRLDFPVSDISRHREGRSSTLASDAVSLSASLSSPRASLDLVESHTPSESLTPSNSSIGKESGMAKLQRKFSTSKFNLGFGSSKEKGSSSSFFSRDKKGGDVTDDGDEDGGKTPLETPTGSPQIGATGDKKGDRSSWISRSSLRRKGKKGDKTPSINESITSEKTDEEEEDGGPKSGDSLAA